MRNPGLVGVTKVQDRCLAFLGKRAPLLDSVELQQMTPPITLRQARNGADEEMQALVASDRIVRLQAKVRSRPGQALQDVRKLALNPGLRREVASSHS